MVGKESEFHFIACFLLQVETLEELLLEQNLLLRLPCDRQGAPAEESYVYILGDQLPNEPSVLLVSLAWTHERICRHCICAKAHYYFIHFFSKKKAHNLIYPDLKDP